MPEQVLQIEPEHELKFKGPLSNPITSLLKLTNPSDKAVGFKIKTTVPKRYCVRPNAGILDSQEVLNIAVVFQPAEGEPVGNKHKFMVQSIIVPDNYVPGENVWKDVDPSKIMDTKLRCAFEITKPQPNPSYVSRLEDTGLSKVQFKKLPTENEATESGDAVKLPADVEQLTQENQYLSRRLRRVEMELLLTQTKFKFPKGDVEVKNPPPPAIPMVYIVLALFAVLVGLVLGKFVL